METRRRILAATRRHLPAADLLHVEEIADLAKVSVQTVYTHFGSKGGLLVALAAETQKEAGLLGFERVWSSNHGEAALRAMLESTFELCDYAWPYIAFTLRVRRSDSELDALITRYDKSRLLHLIVICRRLQKEGRLAGRLTTAQAARLAFSFTTPYVYEALVVQNGLPPRVARALVVDAIIGAVVRPGSQAVPTDKIDWTRLGLRPLDSAFSSNPAQTTRRA